MKYDVLFFIRGLSKDFYVNDDDMFFASISENLDNLLDNLIKSFESFRCFCLGTSRRDLTVFGIRLESETRDEALKKAYRIASGIIDGYSLLSDKPPILSDITFVRNESDNDAHIHLFLTGGWATINDNHGTKAQWFGRNKLMLQQLLKHFDMVANDPKTPRTELRTNIAYALRMYRCGAQSDFAGIEFLSKLSALECLVCGSEKSNKESLLQVNLTALFDNPEIIDADGISRLWKLRCSASHQARAFTDLEDDEQYPLGVATIITERLFSGVVYFALDCSFKANSIADLWSIAPAYQIPEIIENHWPSGVSRMSIETLNLNTKKMALGVGGAFDRCFNPKNRARRNR